MEQDYSRESSWTNTLLGFPLSLKDCLVMRCIILLAWRSCLVTMCMNKDSAQYCAKQHVTTMHNISQQVTHADLISLNSIAVAIKHVILSLVLGHAMSRNQQSRAAHNITDVA